MGLEVDVSAKLGQAQRYADHLSRGNDIGTRNLGALLTSLIQTIVLLAKELEAVSQK